jgi:hypothetical protein
MSTIAAMTLATTELKLGENKPIKVHGFSAKHIASLLNLYPELTHVFREARLAMAHAKENNEAFNIFDLIGVAIEGALESLDKSALSFAVIYALREDISTDEKLAAAIEVADEIPLAWQIRIVSEAFALTMPGVAENFRKAVSNLFHSSENETASNTGSAA